MKEQQRYLLDEMGFNTKKKGCDYFLSISDDVIDLLDKIEHPEDRNDIKEYDPKTFEELKDKLGSLYLEEYAFIIECGKNIYFDTIKSFISTYNPIDDKSIELSRKVLGDSIESLDDMVLNFSIYSYHNFKKENKSKVLIKENENM